MRPFMPNAMSLLVNDLKRLARLLFKWAPKMSVPRRSG
jgi:hypothetical protein